MADRTRVPHSKVQPSVRFVEPGTASRRSFLAAGLAGLGVWGGTATRASSDEAAPLPQTDDGLPLLDLHAHLDGSTIAQVAALAAQRGVKLGIVEHAGGAENVYPVVLSNDEQLGRYLEMLDGFPVYRGVQTEWTDWAACFSPRMLARLDYILTDAMTFPGRDGRRVKLWEKDVESRVDMDDKQAFMDRYVEWHVMIIERQPIDILANTSWLPAPLAADYDGYWTDDRIRRVVEAAVKHGVALEISTGFQLPKRRFLQIAKAAGAKFTFGSNGRFPQMGKLDYSLSMARALGLTAADLFTPAADGQKAVQRRLST